MKRRPTCAIALPCALAIVTLSPPALSQATQTRLHPILFVTVFPLKNDFATFGSVFGNHGKV